MGVGFGAEAAEAPSVLLSDLLAGLTASGEPASGVAAASPEAGRFTWIPPSAVSSAPTAAPRREQPENSDEARPASSTSLSEPHQAVGLPLTDRRRIDDESHALASSRQDRQRR